MTKNLNLFMNLESWKYNQKLAFQEWKYYQDIYLTSRKKNPIEMSEVGQFLIENLEFRNQLSTLELKIQLKIGTIRPKRILEHFINNSKKIWKNPEYDFLYFQRYIEYCSSKRQSKVSQN